MPPKKKNTGYGLLLFASIAMGVSMTQRLQPIQFIIVAKGTILAGIIQGTYIHTEGPIEMPQINIQTMSKAKMKQPEPTQPLNTNKMPITISTIASPTLPKRLIGFLPNFYKLQIAPIVAMSCTPLIMIETYGDRLGIIEATILFACVTIALIPVSCCMKGIQKPSKYALKEYLICSSYLLFV